MGNLKGFLEEVWREVHPTSGRVVWPDKEKVIQSTWVVIASSSLCGIYLFLIDSGFGQIIRGILYAD